MNSPDQIDWDEVEQAASEMFKVWSSGSELQFAKEAWGHFTEAGLAARDTILECTASYLRLVTLARIYEEFCGLAWDENSDTPLSYLGEDLDINELALGFLAAVADPDILDGANDDEEVLDAALMAVTNSQRSDIFECLRKAYGGDAALYSRLSRTRSAEEPEGIEFEVTHCNASAYAYVTNGFQHG